MTIALGLLYEGGGLISADTLISYPSGVGSYDSKIVAYRTDHADVVFALAGNVDYAQGAIEECEEAINNLSDQQGNARLVVESSGSRVTHFTKLSSF